MSRIAKNPIQIPKDVEVVINGQKVDIKGPKGILGYTAHSSVEIVQEDDADGEEKTKVLKFKQRDGSIIAKANIGTTRALVNNMIVGVSQGFERQLELVGVGYRAQVQGKKLNLTLGLSHPVVFDLPEGIVAETPSVTTIVLKGVNKQLLGEVAANIRKFRSPEPYKGKGIRYVGERIVRKETKKK